MANLKTWNIINTFDNTKKKVKKKEDQHIDVMVCLKKMYYVIWLKII